MGYFNKHAALVASTLLTLASVSQSQGLGQAVVENHCSYPAYLWSVSNVQGPEVTLSPGQTYSETYQTNPDGGGISIKVAQDNSITGPILQFEYTLLGVIYYDLSRINGSPFESDGVSLVPSTSTCQAVHCAPSGSCGAGNVFYYPDENSAIEACNADSSITLTLCSGTDGDTTPRRKGKGHRHKVPAPAPSSSQITTPTPAPVPVTSTPPTTWPAPAPTTVSSPAPPAPPATTPAPYIPPGDVVVTTFQTYYTTVDATVDDYVTVTAK